MICSDTISAPRDAKSFSWIRTLPYIKAWNRGYASLGLVVVGVHAPEFEFGNGAENVNGGIRQHGLTYPIAIDNEFAIWRALGNNAWPTKYLFDHRGQLVNKWIGEGRYDEIESEIRRLLAAADPAVRLPPISERSTVFARTGQPSYAGITGETYLGTERREQRTVTLQGDWRHERQRIELRKGEGQIVLPLTAGEVNLVMQPGSSGRAAVTVLLDGRPVGDVRGADVDADGVARFDAPRMVRLVAGAARRPHVLTLMTVLAMGCSLGSPANQTRLNCIADCCSLRDGAEGRGAPVLMVRERAS